MSHEHELRHPWGRTDSATTREAGAPRHEHEPRHPWGRTLDPAGRAHAIESRTGDGHSDPPTSRVRKNGAPGP